VSNDEMLPEILAAAGVAVEFCARPEMWDVFLEWMTDNGFLSAGETVNREFFLQVSPFISVLAEFVEEELVVSSFASKLEDL